MFWTPNKRRVQRWMFGVRSGWWYSCFSFLFLKMSLFLAVPGPRCCAGFSLAAESRGYSVARLAGFPWRWFLLVWSAGPGARELQQLQRVGSVVVAHGLSCSAACGIFSDQGLNWCLLHWQTASSPMSHREAWMMTPLRPLLDSSDVFEKCKSKLHWGITSHQSEWPPSKIYQR